MNPPSPRLLVLGYGNVAQAFLPLLASRSQWLEQEWQCQARIVGLGSRRSGFFIHPTGLAAAELITKTQPLQMFQQTGQSYADALAFIHAGQAAGANTLLELTTLHPEDGEPALTHIRSALAAGMDVVTANKGPLAHASRELHLLARQKGVHLRYESTVMDGLPLLNLVEFTLPAVGIRGFRGLLNSTSSIVLQSMERGQAREEAILHAQQIGVAEANPWYDLDGWDATMKTTILANALLDAQITPAQVQRSGIRDLTPAEIVSAAQADTPIRLVSSAYMHAGIPTARVRPERLQPGDPLYASKDSGPILLETEAMGRITLIEHDTDVVQTAYGVLSDLITIIRARS